MKVSRKIWAGQWDQVRVAALTFLSQSCKGLEPRLYRMDKKPDWKVFLNMVAQGASAAPGTANTTLAVSPSSRFPKKLWAGRGRGLR